MRKLYRLLCEYIHLLKINPDRKKVYKKLYPNQSFDDLHLRHLCNYLLIAAEAYLIDSTQNQADCWHLLSIYRKRNLGKLFEHQYKKTLKRLEKSPLRHPEYFWQRYHIEKEYFEWEVIRGRSEKLNMEGQEYWLHIASIGFKLRQACSSLAHQQLNNKMYDIPMLEVFLAEAKKTLYQKIPMIRIYTQAIDLYKQKDQDPNFEDFSKSINENIVIFPQVEARDLLLSGINFGIRAINRGHQASLAQTLALYQKGLERDLFLENGQLTVFTYNNIAGIAIRLKEISWANHFINTYKSRLERKYRDTVYALNAARLAYAQQAYKQALELLKTTNDRDFIHHMSARILQLKIYIDTDDVDQTLKHIRNTLTYLKRRKHTAYHVQNYRNILSLTEAYCKLQIYDRKAVETWKKKVENTSPLTEKEWLLARF